MNKNYDYKRLTPFKWFVLQNFPFIDEDFDAITNYQLFCKLGEEINKIIDSQNIVGEQAENLTNAFNNLKNYVDNYFDNLDVQDEINNKLNEMAEDGTLQEIISEYLNSKAIFGFDNVEEMKNATNLTDGSYAQTLGYHIKGDGGRSLYKIRLINENDEIDNGTLIKMKKDNLVAELISDGIVNLKQFGAYGDSQHDDSSAWNNMINSSFKRFYVPEGIYSMQNDIYLKDRMNLKGANLDTNILLSKRLILKENSNANYNCDVSDITFRVNGTSRTYYAIDLSDIVYSTWNNVKIRSDDGINSWNGMILRRNKFTDCYDNTINNCFFQRASLTLSNSTDNFITNNKIWADNFNANNTPAGLYNGALNLGGNVGNNLIQGNHFISTNNAGIQVVAYEKPSLLIIDNNYFDGCNYGISGFGLQNAIITNTRFFHCETNAIKFTDANDLTISNNIIYTTGIKTDIKFTKLIRGSLIGNKFISTASSKKIAIAIDDTTSSNTLVANTADSTKYETLNDHIAGTVNYFGNINLQN